MTFVLKLLVGGSPDIALALRNQRVEGHEFPAGLFWLAGYIQTEGGRFPNEFRARISSVHRRCRLPRYKSQTMSDIGDQRQQGVFQQIREWLVAWMISYQAYRITLVAPPSRPRICPAQWYWLALASLSIIRFTILKETDSRQTALDYGVEQLYAKVPVW